jgi:hypothetical protein
LCTCIGDEGCPCTNTDECTGSLTCQSNQCASPPPQAEGDKNDTPPDPNEVQYTLISSITVSSIWDVEEQPAYQIKAYTPHRELTVIQTSTQGDQINFEVSVYQSELDSVRFEVSCWDSNDPNTQNDFEETVRYDGN